MLNRIVIFVQPIVIMLTMNELLEKTLRIGVKVHTGQVDKVGKPYIGGYRYLCGLQDSTIGDAIEDCGNSGSEYERFD